MTHLSSKRLQRLLMIGAAFVFSLVVNSSIRAQVAPRAGGPKPVEKQPATPPRTIIRRPRRERPKPDAGSAADESDQFLQLGDEFYEKGRLTAAEVAYKE